METVTLVISGNLEVVTAEINLGGMCGVCVCSLEKSRSSKLFSPVISVPSEV